MQLPRLSTVASIRLHAALLLLLVAACALSGCQSLQQSPAGIAEGEMQPSFPINAQAEPQTEEPAAADASPIQTVSHHEPVSTAPPRIADFFVLPRQPLTLDHAVQLALSNSTVLSTHGSSILATPAATTTFDAAVAAADPNASRQAALSAYDMQLEGSLRYNGNGNALSSTGQFGVFSQPETMASAGVGKYLQSGTKVSLGAFGGYDRDIAGGAYAAYGAELRHPLMRGSGNEINAIAGPQNNPGRYQGVLLAELGEQAAQLMLEGSVQSVVREIAFAYWELHFAYQHVEAKHGALEHARSVWRRQQQRTLEAAAPADLEALAYQQFFNAKAELDNAIAGTQPGHAGVFQAELKLRQLLGLPGSDGQLLLPVAQPITAEMIFNWEESVATGHARRLELRKHQAGMKRRELEIKAAANAALPQVDLVARYSRLADDGSQRSATFSEAIDSWHVGLQYSQALGGRREDAAVRHASLQMQREKALLQQQYRSVTADLRKAFVELDRAHHVMQSMAASQRAAATRATAEQQRYDAGNATLEKLIDAQNAATRAKVAHRRAVVDYNLAFLRVHLAQGTLLDATGVAFAPPTAKLQRPEQHRYAQQSPSVYAAPARHAELAPIKPAAVQR